MMYMAYLASTDTTRQHVEALVQVRVSRKRRGANIGTFRDYSMTSILPVALVVANARLRDGVRT